MFQSDIFRFGIFEFGIFVYPLFDKYFLQRCKQKLLGQFVTFDIELFPQQSDGIVGTSPQHLRHCYKHRLVIVYHTAVWRILCLAVSKGIQSVYRLVERCFGFEMKYNLYTFGGIVVYLLYVYLTFFVCLYDALYELGSIQSVWDIIDNKTFVVCRLGDIDPHHHFSAAFAVVVATHVYHTACGEVGIQTKFFTLQIEYGSIYKFVEVMGQYLGIQSITDTFATLSQQ